jgi:serine protease Do
MRLRLAAGLLGMLIISGCATTSNPAAPLPAVRVKELGDLLSAGSFLQALEEVATLRRDKSDVPAADLDAVESRAVEALSAEFAKAVAEKRWDDALRLLGSAAAIGKAGLAQPWSEAGLRSELAAGQEASGDLVLALLTRFRIIGQPGSTQGDFDAAMDLARRMGNRAAVRWLAAAMASKGLSVPAQVVADAQAAPSFEKMLTGTVTILVNRGIKVEKGVGYPDRVIGSGFFIDRRGYILTNHHVIESEVDPKYDGYSRLYIRLSESPAGEKLPAKVIGWDTVFDLALLKVEVTPEFVFSGSSDQAMAPGDRIFAIGSPAGLEKTITSGIISAMGRRFLQMGDAMQVDVPLNPGNSGGPLLTEKGDLIGIVFAGLQQFQGINFAVPYGWIEKALPALYRGGSAVHPWLGIAVAETEKGLEVLYALPDETAARTGIKAGDIIEGINGATFSTLGAIQEAVLRFGAPSLVRVAFRRAGVPMEALVCLRPRLDNPIEVALKRDQRDTVLYPLFGMQLQNVGSFLWKGEYIVTRVTKGSVADESGVSVDDPITIQDWQVDTEKGYAALQIVIKKKRAGFLESAIQIAAYLETDNFI